MNIITKLTFILLAFNQTNCCKDIDKCPRFFTLPVTFSPVKNVYKIGDTISIISQFPDQLIGLNIEEEEIRTFDMKRIKWKPVISFYKLDTIIPKRDDHVSTFTNYVQYNYLLGNLMLERFSTGSERIYGEYFENINQFSISLKLVIMKKGVFYVEFDSDNNTGTFGFQDYPGVCNREKLHVFFKTNEGKNNNLNYLKESPDPFWDRSRPNGYTGDIYGKEPEKVGGFCFKVE